MVIWKKGRDDLDKVTVTRGYYWLTYEKKGVPFKDLDLPFETTIAGKRCVVTQFIELENEVKFRVWVAENPFPIIALVWGVAAIALSIGLICSGKELLEVVKVGLPLSIIVLVGVLILWNQLRS